jgi:hypothetical protein
MNLKIFFKISKLYSKRYNKHIFEVQKCILLKDAGLYSQSDFLFFFQLYMIFSIFNMDTFSSAVGLSEGLV